MQLNVGYIYIWNAMIMSFNTKPARNLLFEFMDNEDIYCKIVEDFGEAIDLNMILDDGDFASKIYVVMRPELKDELQTFLKNGKKS
jgi:hypothetical protein